MGLSCWPRRSRRARSSSKRRRDTIILSRGAGAGGACVGGDQRETGRENGQGSHFRIFRRGAFRAPVRALEAGADAGVRRLLRSMVELPEGETAVGEKW